MYVRDGRPAFAPPYVGVHRRRSLMSSSLLLQQCPACLVRLTWIVFVMGGQWPYIWCLGGVSARTCSILLATFLCNCRLASSPAVLLASNWCIHTAVSTRSLPGRNCVSFYRSGLTSIWLIAYRWRTARGDEQWEEVAREGQGYPCWRHDIMMMMKGIFVGNHFLMSWSNYFLYNYCCCLHTNGFKYCNSTLIILFSINHFFVHSGMVLSRTHVISFICIHLKSFKYFYSTLIILFNIIYSFAENEMKCVQVLLCNINNLI